MNEFESKIIEFLQTNASTGWITLFQFITLLGSYLGFAIIFVILFIKQRKLSYVFAVTFIVASVFNQFLKMIIARDRPFVADPQIANYGGEDGYSMPSGHSLCGGLFATFLFYNILTTSKYKTTKILGGAFCILFPFLIAYSRMVLGVHYLSDTLVGITLGVIFAILGILVYRYCIKKYNTRKTKENLQ